MAEIFLISDTHFGHTNILNFTRADGTLVRPGFRNTHEMDEKIIENWNKVIRPQDKVYHLGDVYIGSQQNCKHILMRLNGHKRLVLGNHDKGKDTVLNTYFDKIDMWRIFKEFNLILSHIPLREDQLRKVEYNVHGHIHQQRSPSEMYKCVCVEHTDYTPIHIEEVLKLKTHI